MRYYRSRPRGPRPLAFAREAGPSFSSLFELSFVRRERFLVVLRFLAINTKLLFRREREREILENQQEITTLTVIWAWQLVSPQPKLGPVP